MSWLTNKLSGFLNLYRLYKLSDSLHIFFQLHRKKKSYHLAPSFLKSPIHLRDNFSDKAIFLQVFIENQYSPIKYDFPEIRSIVDGGANIGLASIFFTQMFPNAQIIAIEPDSRNFEVLIHNTKHYNNIECFKGAIWDTNEEIHISNPKTLAASYEVARGNKDNNALKGVTMHQVLRSKNWKQADMIKLDIEGAEKEVFEALDTSWLGGTKLLIIELHDRYKPGCTKAVFKALEAYDYEASFHHENIFIRFNHHK